MNIDLFLFICGISYTEEQITKLQNLVDNFIEKIVETKVLLKFIGVVPEFELVSAEYEIVSLSNPWNINFYLHHLIFNAMTNNLSNRNYFQTTFGSLIYFYRLLFDPFKQENVKQIFSRTFRCINTSPLIINRFKSLSNYESLYSSTYS